MLPCAALAHPHVFVDASITLRYDAEGQLASVEEVWAYDEFYSLVMLSEVGEPGAGGFDPGQMANLQGLDTNWDPLNGGTLAIESPRGLVPTTSPRHISTRVEGNSIVTRRSHTIVAPISGEIPVSIRVYDPTYYVSFTMPSQVLIQGRTGCGATLQSGNVRTQNDAYATALRDALARELGRAGPDDVQVDIGAVGADSIAISCTR